jgi:glycosyltransferase involved in cell wall biosynthesis
MLPDPLTKQSKLFKLITMFKISILHPSRNRAIRGHACYANWLVRSSGKVEIEWIVSIDDDDSQAEEYRLRFNPFAAKVIQNKNRSMVDAVNAAAKVSTGDLLVVVSDDFDCPADWDQGLMAIFNNERDNPYYAVHVNDGYSYPMGDPSNRLLTLPIVTRHLYSKIGYVYHPAYFSMYADNDLYEVCAKHFRIVDAGHLLFEHLHPSLNKSPEDATFRRQNSAQAYQMGKAIFAQRQSNEFPI